MISANLVSFSVLLVVLSPDSYIPFPLNIWHKAIPPSKDAIVELRHLCVRFSWIIFRANHYQTTFVFDHVLKLEIYKHKIFIKWAYYHMVLPRNSRRNLLLSENFSKCILAFWGLKNLTFCNVMLSGKWKNFINPKDNIINIKRKVIYFIKQFFTVG